MLQRSSLVCAFVSALSIAFLLPSPSYAVTPDRITNALNSGQSVSLQGYIHRNARPEFDQGPADPALRFGSIMLQTTPTPSQQKALNRLLADQQNPKSPNYHKWLTPEQWADRFGLSPNDVRKVTTWLKAQGFRNIYVARGRNWFMFSGTAAQVQNTFGTEIHQFNVNGEMHVANATSPQIPATLAGIVSGVTGLDDFYLRPRARVRNFDLRPLYSSAKFGDLLAPGDIATIYDINNLYSGGIDGTGQLLAVIGQTDIFQSDISDFRTGFGLSSISCTSDTTTNLITACSDTHFQYVLVPNAPDPKKASAGDLAEADLDIEWSGAVARNAQIIYVNAPVVLNSMGNLVSGGVDVAWKYAVDNNLAPVITLSYGLCEFGYSYSVATGNGEETELQKANSLGITFVNSSGDAGAAGCDGGVKLAVNGLAVSYPASSPEVTGVGGTSIARANFTSTYWNTTNGGDGGSAISYIPEQVWNDDEEIGALCAANPSNAFCKTGGTPPVSGWTPITNAQTAQTDIGISQSGGGPSNCATQNAGLTSCVSGFPQPSWQTVTISGQTAARFTPDVAFLSSPNFPGYILCTQLSELGKMGSGSTCASGISTAVDTYGSIIGGTSAAAPVFAGMVALLNQYLEGPSAFGLGNINPMLYSLAKTPSNGAFHQMTTTGDAKTNDVYCSPGTPSSMPAAMQCPSSGVFGFSVSSADATTGYNLVTGLGSIDLDKLVLAWAATRTSSSTTASSSPATVFEGGSVTLTATVTPSTATGNVSFNNGTTALGTATLTSGGTASLTTSSLPLGSNSITATYNGSGTLGNSTSSPITVTVNAAIASFTPTAASFPVTQGSATDATVALTLASGFTGQVTFACQNPGSEITCTAPAAVTASGNVSFHLTTQAPTVALWRPFGRSSGILYAALMPGLLGIVFVAGSRERSLRSLRMLGLMMVLGASTMWLGSCGGSNNSSTKNPGTPKGNYTINVTATPAGGGATNASFTLTVQ